MDTPPSLCLKEGGEFRDANEQIEEILFTEMEFHKITGSWTWLGESISTAPGKIYNFSKKIARFSHPTASTCRLDSRHWPVFGIILLCRE